MFDAATVARLTSGSTAGWAMVIIALGWIIKTWPVWKQRVNEARKIELDAEGNYRGSLFTRIRELEENQSKDRIAFQEAMHEERARCDAELEKRDTEIRSLIAMIRQNSESTAVMIGNPEGAAITNAARKARGEGRE